MAKKKRNKASSGSQDLAALFDTIDNNGDGRVSKRELKTALKANDEAFAAALGMRRLKDVHSFVSRLDLCDLDKDGSIDKQEFQRLFGPEALAADETLRAATQIQAARRGAVQRRAATTSAPGGSPPPSRVSPTRQPGTPPEPLSPPTIVTRAAASPPSVPRPVPRSALSEPAQVVLRVQPLYGEEDRVLISDALLRLEGVRTVHVDLPRRLVRIDGTASSVDLIATLEALGLGMRATLVTHTRGARPPPQQQPPSAASGGLLKAQLFMRLLARKANCCA